jgi:hypothetical protein
MFTQIVYSLAFGFFSFLVAAVLLERLPIRGVGAGLTFPEFRAKMQRRRLLALALGAVVAIASFPFLASAQDPSDIVQILPAKWQGPAFAIWLLGFYVVGPILKRFPSHTWVGKAGEWLTQDTRRPATTTTNPQP